jgi:hypothetical protein
MTKSFRRHPCSADRSHYREASMTTYQPKQKREGQPA